MKNTIEERRDFARIVNACLSTYSVPELTAEELREWFRALAGMTLVQLSAALFEHVGKARDCPPTPADVLRLTWRAA